RPRSHYSLGWLPRWAAMAAQAPRLTNRLLRGRLTGAIARSLGGVDPRRPLPTFAETTFRQWFATHPAADGEPVVLWVDTWTNHFTPQVGVAAVRVLENAGF